MNIDTLVSILHYASCVMLILFILLQAGKGADASAIFGGSSQTVFGSRGAATFLSKLTAIAATLFLVTSLILAAHAKKTKTVIPKNINTESQATESQSTESEPSTESQETGESIPSS